VYVIANQDNLGRWEMNWLNPYSIAAKALAGGSFKLQCQRPINNPLQFCIPNSNNNRQSKFIIL
jgi:hypothetical protein